MCHIAGFIKATGECHLGLGDSSDVLDGDSDDDGVFILKGKHRCILNDICNSVLLKKRLFNIRIMTIIPIRNVSIK